MSKLLLEYDIGFREITMLCPDSGEIKSSYKQIRIPAKHNDRLEEIIYEFLFCHEYVSIMHDTLDIIRFDVPIQLPVDYTPLPVVRNILLAYERMILPSWGDPICLRFTKHENDEIYWHRTSWRSES